MHFDYENKWYIEYGKLSNGQTAMIVFDRYERGCTTYYWVIFGIANKKKVLKRWLYEQEGSGNLGMECTGNCGAEGLIWAYHKIEEFINENWRWGSNKVHSYKIAVQGSDNRRYKIYKHFLKRLGFVEEIDPEWGRTLVKKI